MALKEKNDDMEWSAEEEIQLFFALDGLKPVGVNKHFFMACITERLSKSLNRDISPENIWSHLRDMYNLEFLDELEPLPFPNEQKDFSLPDTEFSSLMSRKKSEIDDHKTDIKEKSAGSSRPIISSKEIERKINSKFTISEAPKRTQKRTRGSISLDPSSPSTTPPLPNSKRRRI